MQHHDNLLSGQSFRILDLMCKQGGASKGYADAGFEVVGVDLDPQPRYPYEFRQNCALKVLDGLLFGARLWTQTGASYFLDEFDAIHASPPCQAYTNAQKIQKNEHPDLIGPVRDLLIKIGKPYVIENVPGAPLHDPVELCGAMFGLRTYRHRLFESNIPLIQPHHPEHVAKTTKMGRRPKDGENMHIVGNFSGVDLAREVMGMQWASRDGLREAIPPVYTRYIGRQIKDHLDATP